MNLLDKATIEGVQGFLHCAELEKLAELATGRDVLEVGAFMGLSAWGMAQTAKSVQSVDSFEAATDGQRQTGELTTLEAYMRAVAPFPNVLPPVVATSEVAAGMLHGQFSFIFIDAMHDYANCLADILRWLPKLKPGGVLAGHDYGHADWPGVKQAFDEVFGSAPEGTTVVTLRWITKP